MQLLFYVGICLTLANSFQIYTIVPQITRITRKRFSEKPIVTFTNNTVLILDLLSITKPVWSHVLALSARALKKAHTVSCQEASAQITNACKANSSPIDFPGSLSPDYKCMQGQFLTNRDFPPKSYLTIRYIIGVFCYNFKSQISILASYRLRYRPCSGIYTSHTLCRITQA